jgi:hypothetical protein
MTATRILHYLGLLACLLLIGSAFLPWAYYGDPSISDEAQRTFTGFYTFQNYYGKPGKFLCLCAGISLALKLLPKVWAKRVDLFLCALCMAYALKAFFEYKGVYFGVVPQAKIGLYLMLGAALVMMMAAIFPDLRILEKRKGS